MHVLHLLRHAKSARSEDMDDRERPLTRRGRDAAGLIGRHLPTVAGRPDLVLCSSALRTRETLAQVLADLPVPPRVLVENALYLAGAASLIRRLRQLAESDGNVLLIGHNPGLHELALALAASETPFFRELADGKFPTAALASLEVDAPWSTIDRSRHRLIGYATPKSLGGKDD